jgi:hypothetical protein
MPKRIYTTQADRIAVRLAYRIAYREAAMRKRAAERRGKASVIEAFPEVPHRAKQAFLQFCKATNLIS